LQLESMIDALRRMGLVRDGEAVRFEPLTGGVSSDIHLVEVGERRFCVKRALAQLKVAAEWRAPLARNGAEAAWMRTIARWLPHGAPAILGEDASIGMFAMTYLPPDENPVWKAKLLAGRVDVDFAGAVGRDLATIHAGSAKDSSLPARFANEATFEDIRIEPYLRATGRAHPPLAARLDALAEATLANKRALVHGDISPKNTLIGKSGPIFLDAECACFGDPAFDLAFCLNHILLKGARSAVAREPYLAAYRALANAYLAGVDWESRESLEARAAALLPALFLARIDGKSPVEYLVAEAEKDAVRRCAAPLVEQPPVNLAEIAEIWSRSR
jgi:aminoglycoside phosphotransferase (APT) family kinase protein